MGGDPVRVTPLVLHAQARLPALTDLFSDRLEVASMTVEYAGKVTFTLPQAHGLPNGATQALSVVDADTPNPITAATIQNNGDITFTTQYEHDLSTAPGGSSVSAWNQTTKLAGFASSVLNGPLQLVSVDARNAFTVKPSQHVSSITLNGNEVLLERLESGIIGWHKVYANGPTTLQFDTPDEITRNYTVPNPSVVNNIRVVGTLSLETAKKQCVRGYKPNEADQDEGEVNKAWMFICPPQVSRLSRDRNSTSDAMTEQTASSDRRMLYLDGFFVFVFLPAENSSTGITVSDLAHGPILTAILRTFHGLSLPRNELWHGDAFTMNMVEHGNMLGDYDNATYIHGYSFEAPAYLTKFDAIQPFEWSAINETTMTAASGIGPGAPGGTLIQTDPLPVGSVAFRDLVFGPSSKGSGIQHDDATGSLTAVVPLT